jgi:hypothetical protein
MNKKLEKQLNILLKWSNPLFNISPPFLDKGSVKNKKREILWELLPNGELEILIIKV